MPDTADEPSVLVVDDEEQVADLYGTQLGGTYDVTVVYGGAAALEAVSEDTDVVLLDRRMPGMTGDEVLEEIRDRGYECRVVMVSAVDPDFDIADMPFHDYLCKPVSSDDLRSVVAQQVELAQYDPRVTEYLELQSKIMLLEVEKRAAELEDSEEYQRLTERAAALEDEVYEIVDDFEEIRETFERLQRGP